MPERGQEDDPPLSATVLTQPLSATAPVGCQAIADEPYTIFDRKQKGIIVCIASVAATFSGFAGNSYFPAIPTISNDLDVSVELINLTVTTYLIFQGIAPSLWGPISDVKGRRVAYCFTFIVFLGACIGLAESKNYTTLIILRCLQSTGSASTIAIGSGVIGDITTRADRGGLMGVFQAGLLVPVAVAPVIGGALAGSLGWRSIFWFLAIYSGVFLAMLVLLLPETLRSVVGNGGRTPSHLISRYPLRFYQRATRVKWQHGSSGAAQAASPLPRKHIDLTGPFRILASKQTAPIIIYIAVYYTVWQLGVTAMAPLFEEKFGLGETQIGLTFMGNGAGSIIGTLVTGKILDMDYRRVQELYEGSKQQDPSQVSSTTPPRDLQVDTEPDEETTSSGSSTEDNTATTSKTNHCDGPQSSGNMASPPTTPNPSPKQDSDPLFPLEKARLRLLPFISVIQCLSVLLFGWTLAYSDHIHMSIPIIATFITGWTAVSAMSIATTYLVDIYPDRSAAAGASLNLARCLFGAGGVSFVMPLVRRIGVGWAFTVLGVGLQGVGLGGLILQMIWGRRWRVKAHREAVVAREQGKG